MLRIFHRKQTKLILSDSDVPTLETFLFLSSPSPKAVREEMQPPTLTLKAYVPSYTMGRKMHGHPAKKLNLSQVLPKRNAVSSRKMLHWPKKCLKVHTLFLL